jgi:hypothetical protein
LADVSADSVPDQALTRDIQTRDAALLTYAVREAGALALSLFRTELKNWTKGASSPVSEADIRVNDLLENRLRSVTPDYGWLSEESADDEQRLGKRLVWIVDPIDGTRGYLAGREDWCVSVALVEDASPAMNFSSPCAGRAPRLTMRRFVRHRASSWIFPASPGRSLLSNGSTGLRTKLSCIPVSDRWRFGCAGSRMEAWMLPLRVAKAATGTLRRPI